jgi:CubicO group peptidase (beta-lactamase class C family)
MGGVAGHAGLFSTADDLTRYCRMLLRGGELDGTRVLAVKTVKLFTEPHAVPVPTKGGEAKGFRSLGWDVDTSYSAPRGEVFAKGEGYGHTGFTGTSVWVDPGTKTAVIVLTNRVHPDDKGNVTQLRREIGTIVARAVGKK